MPPMDFDDAAAERLEAAYLGHDVAAQRVETLRLLALQPGERVLDIGSGPGFLCRQMAEAVGPEGRVRGVDLSPDLLRRATARNQGPDGRPWLSFAAGDAAALDEADAGYDVVVSVQVAEYVPDIAAFCREAFRVLRPGGRGLIIATDWDAVAWYSADPARMARVLDAFRPHCADSVLPRTLAPRLRAAGFDLTGVSAFPMINLDRAEGNYSTGMARLILDYVRSRQALPEAELAAWDAEQAALADAGRYYFMTARVMFAVRRPG